MGFWGTMMRLLVTILLITMTNSIHHNLLGKQLLIFTINSDIGRKADRTGRIRCCARVRATVRRRGGRHRQNTGLVRYSIGFEMNTRRGEKPREIPANLNRSIATGDLTHQIDWFALVGNVIVSERDDGGQDWIRNSIQQQNKKFKID